MKALCFLFIIGCLACACNGFKYETKSIEMLIDHYNFIDNKTFSLRYLVNESFVQDKKSPILFYTGNEGDIELFAENTGFMWKAAEELGAMLVIVDTF